MNRSSENKALRAGLVKLYDKWKKLEVSYMRGHDDYDSRFDEDTKLGFVEKLLEETK